MAQAFARSNVMVAAIAAAMSLSPVADRNYQLSLIGSYRSRGKGRGTPMRQYGNRSGRYSPHQGKREVARRQRQIAAGVLTMSNGLCLRVMAVDLE